MSRVLIVSNRLPVTVRHEGGHFGVEPSTGGLATGLASTHAKDDGLWIGWPGPTWELDSRDHARLDRQLRERRLEPVHLSEDDIQRYYEGFSNGLLWPLFHYMLGQIPLRVEDWKAYKSVNERFAEHVVQVWRPGDSIWVHDYQLLLLPGMLRARLPDARIGFFLHIPVPASDVLRALPHREEILLGVLGADLIGLHTPTYVRHFVASLLHILGLETRVDAVQFGSREVKVGAFPMGIDAASFGKLGDGPDVNQRAHEIRGTSGCRLLLGIDRLDYTKGIPRRLLAYEELLHTKPEHHSRIQLIQLAIPSRGGVRAYRKFRESVDGLVGRIQGRFATATWSPVRYLHRSVERQEVAALYRAADVILVTPIRDGMNLVAKEFVATRTDEDGVLVLSEFAGASSELDGAILVNPYDVRGSALAYHHALQIDREERRVRMRRLRARVAAADVQGWTANFLTTLDTTGPVPDLTSLSTPGQIHAVLARTRQAPELVVLLDYDGTLVPFAPTPDEAAPGAELVSLLSRLGTREHTQVHIVSGRPRKDLEQWFGELPIGLHAEHGLWSRLRTEREWRRAPASNLPCADSIEALLEDWAARTPGSFVERKSVVRAWHWRLAEPDHGRRQERELRLHLAEVLSNVAVEVVVGEHVVEVRPQGIHKGTIVALATASCDPGALIVAMGDDRTDEDLFAALGSDHVTIRVGTRPGRATLRLADPAVAREFLNDVATTGEPTVRA